MKAFQIQSLFLFVAAAAFAQDNNLPTDSAGLLSKLDDFTEEERAATEERIKEKSRAVIALLKTHLERETKAGDLEAGIALKREIERLEEAAGGASFSPAAPVSNSGHLTVKIQIDGYSELKLRGSELWIDHTKGSGALPGKHSGENPTTVDRTEWMPKWDGRITDRYQLKESLPVDDASKLEIRVKKLEGRGEVEVLDQPTKENDFTTKFGMKDGGSGADWLEFRISW